MRYTWALAALAAVSLSLAACKTDDTAKKIEDLKIQIRADQELLRAEAETRDPSRKNLKAEFVDTSVMAVRPTSNPERPYVGYVRVQWRFSYTDGRPLGDAVFDYVYALTPDSRWIKADEAEFPAEAGSRDGVDDKPPLPQEAAAPSPA
jgi:hypothetical protein